MRGRREEIKIHLALRSSLGNLKSENQKAEKNKMIIINYGNYY